MRTSKVAVPFLALFGGMIWVASAQAQEQRQPPQIPSEAYTACEGKASGSTCSVQFGDRSLSGTCEAPPPNASNKALACRPSGPPPGPPPSR